MSSGANRPGRGSAGEEPPAETSFAELLNGFSFDSVLRRERKPRTDDDAGRVQEEDVAARPPEDDFDPPGEESASIVRAYAWTGGRTKSEFALQVETMVSATSAYVAAAMQAEHHEVLELCQHPRSVAEVAALMRLPLGVAKVLLGDMAGRGLIDVHETASGGTAPDLGLMERVLSGLRRL
ncbi:MAG TPA: DUF742 domain-containing protein [Pseudonocardiaceae bacterium]|jgi:hypothetical protein|nr:DUF742 domain-containing protein [Pseudonocardiaceae bacterium]